MPWFLHHHLPMDPVLGTCSCTGLLCLNVSFCVLCSFFVLSSEREKLLTFFSLCLQFCFYSLCVTCISPCFDVRYKAKSFLLLSFLFGCAGRETSMCKEQSPHPSRFPHDSAASLFLLTLSSCAFSCWFRCRRRAFASDTLGAQGGQHGEGFLYHPPCSPCLRPLPSFLFLLVCGCTY